MAKCFIAGETLMDLNGKQACLKIFREQDNKKLSRSFDNSCGGFGNECRRIEACIFTTYSPFRSNPEKTIYISNSQELASVISNFVSGW